MAHMTQAFHLQHENMLTLMATLQQLNAAEESGDVHEVRILLPGMFIPFILKSHQY